MIKKLKQRQYQRYQKLKQSLKNFDRDCVQDFKHRISEQNNADRVILGWKIIDIHQIPNPFKIGNEVDFWCCNDKKLVLLRIRHQSYQKFTAINPDIKKQIPTYWIAELPVAPSLGIDDEFLLKILQVFDKSLDKIR